MVPVLGATWILNAFDAAATLFLVGGGYAVEANPLMAYVLALGPIPFAGLKIAVVSAGAFVLWRFAGFAIARFGAIAVCAIYVLVSMYHLGGIGTLVV